MQRIFAGVRSSVTIALTFILVLVLARTAAAQNAGAQNQPLNFGNNFFVTGDYVVAGAQGMTSHLNGGIATGTFSIPDGNPGVRGTTTVPRGANIIAALLYWQTVEKVGNLGTGQHGFFRPVFKGGPATGYPITGANLPSHTTVSFSTGGCSGGSTGKIVQTYRADVRGFLPLDANGNVLVDSADGVTFEVRLPSVGTQTPLTLGATLVLIYRVVSPNYPLNVITILDGAFAPNSTNGLTMSLPIQGFYQAGNSLVPGNNSPVSKLTHIVGSGQSNKFQTVSLSGSGPNRQGAPVALPSPYGAGQPAFPGWYGGDWDNTTWVFPDPQLNLPVNPLQEFDNSATTTVTPSGSQMGCVSWGAVILSTTVDDPDKDGILPVWKNNKGYTDVATQQFVSLADPDPLNQPQVGQQDIFIQMDHVVDVNGDFTPDPNAVSMVKSAFRNHNIHLHITDASKTTGVAGANIINEPGCTDQPLNNPPYFCPYPNQPGITTWRYGFEFVKFQPVNYPDENSCEAAALNAPCIRRFPIAQRNSHHYVVFGDTLGAANWAFLGGILTDSTGTAVPGHGTVSQLNNTVTFETSKGHGLTVDNAQHTLANGRVTVSNAHTNPDLNGTFFVTSVSCPTNPDTNVANDCSVTNKAAGPYSFTISIGGSAVTANYTLQTDPDLAVASGLAGSGSGLSDVAGMGTLVTLGKWGADATLSAKAGTLMHELGHTLGLALHGGFYYDNFAPGQAIPDYRPTVEANCKSNYQSVMNYMFQTRLLTNGALDFSSQKLSSLDETNLGPITTTDPQIAFPTTDWYDTKPTFVIRNGQRVPLGTAATHHCDDTPLNSTDPTTYFYQGGTTPQNHPNELDIPWSNIALDANFEGNPPGSEPHPFRGYNDWANVDLRQVGATGSSLAGPGGLFDGPGGLFDGPGGLFDGPGGLFDGPGGLFDGPGGLFDGPGGLFDGPGGLFDGPGGLFDGPGELDLRNALSVTPPPTSLSAVENASPRTIRLTWNEPNFPATDHNNIYRSSDGVNFAFIASVPGVQPAGSQNSFLDTVTCNPNGYSYFVTTVALNTTTNPPSFQESTQSNTVSVGQNNQLLTGCYTPPVFSSPTAGSSPLQGSVVPITWTLPDATNNNGFTFANNPGSNTLVAIGPISDDALCTTAIGPSTTISSAGAGITFNAGTNQFSFSWITAQGFNGNLAAPFPQGCYRLELDLDSGQPTLGGQPPSAFQVQLYLSDVNESVRVTTTSLPNATEGTAYNQTLQVSGDVVLPVSWTFTGTLPPGLILNSAGNISGTPTKGGTYAFTVKGTDAIGDFGTQALTLLVNAVVTTTSDTGAGSLRQAILDLNSQPGPQPVGIFFNIPAAGVQTITPATSLPPSVTPTILDATTQPGWVGPPIIELNGSTASLAAAPAAVNGIHVAAGSSTVHGLVIDSFSGDGILIDTNGGNTVQGNYIGTDPTGTMAKPNGGNGVQIVATSHNTIGGANVISGNAREGVRIDGTLATNNFVGGNFIGTDHSGSLALGNSASGVYIRHAPANSVAGNVISGNLGFAGVTICGFVSFCGGGDVGVIDETSNAAGNAVQGNFIGTDASGANPLGNAQAGVSIDGAPNTQVGRTLNPNIISNSGTNDVQIFDAGANGNQVQGNTIHGSAAAGNVGINVLTAGLTGNTFSQNSISGHQGLGIDITPTGVNANTPGGTNNFPVISSATVASGTISGSLNGPANATFTLEFFSNAACNASGNGEGAVFLKAATVITDGTGNIPFAVQVVGLVAGNRITATSTDANGTTSEFSACVTAN